MVWSIPPGKEVTKCSTHPDALDGLTVLPGTFDSAVHTNVVVSNDSVVNITLTDQQPLAMGEFEDELPDLDDFIELIDHYEAYRLSVDWNGTGKDIVEEIASPKPDKRLVTVKHVVPRFAACQIWRATSRMA